MLTAFRLGNFKAFAETQRLPIKPLTLIFGPNSAGKSSLIHGLLFGRHAHESGDLDVHRTEIGGESVDLGGFRQYVHRRDHDALVEWGADISIDMLTTRLAELLGGVTRLGIVVTAGLVEGYEGAGLRGRVPAIISYTLSIDGRVALRLSRRRDATLRLDLLDRDHPVIRHVLTAVLQANSTRAEPAPEDFERFVFAVDDLVPSLTATVRGILPDGISLREAEAVGPQQIVERFRELERRIAETADRAELARLRQELASLRAMRNALVHGSLMPVATGGQAAEAVRLWLPGLLDEIVREVNGLLVEQLTRVAYLGPLRSYPPRRLAFAQYHDPNWYAGGGFAWDRVRCEADVRKAVNDWLGGDDPDNPKHTRLQTPYELTIRDLIGVDDLDRPLFDTLARLGDRRGRRTRDVPDDARTLFREALDESPSEIVPELVLVDRRSNTPVSHRDVGIGISQVLPVLVSAYGHRDKIVAIEQPEIHLHPRLQAELGDLFIESSLGERKNTFILETHSEQLILRIMRRMRNTFNEELPNGLPPVTPEDVAILYVEPRGTSAVVRELELDEEGKLLDPWPGGFFEEGFKERFS